MRKEIGRFGRKSKWSSISGTLIHIPHLYHLPHAISYPLPAAHNYSLLATFYLGAIVRGVGGKAKRQNDRGVWIA